MTIAIWLTRAIPILAFLALLTPGQSLRAQRAGAAPATSSAPATTATPTTTATTAPTPNPRVHDPSTIVQCNDEYWFFYTGSGVRSYRSRDLRQWEPGPPVFDKAPQWAQRFGLRGERLWAPDIVRAADGRYFLYYSASSWGKNVSAIGLAINATLDPRDLNYRWVDQGPVIESERTDDYNAIDPALTFDADGKLWLSFGSFWSGIKLVQLDATTGKPIAPDAKPIALANQKEIEAPFIHRRRDEKGGDTYYLFVNFGLCCRGVKSTYNIRVGRSARITGPYLDKDGKDLREGGGTLLLGSAGSMIGPGHAGIVSDGKREWLSFHFYDAEQRGRATLALRAITWDEDGWPVVEPGAP